MRRLRGALRRRLVVGTGQALKSTGDLEDRALADVQGAVTDALAPLGVSHVEMPLTPETIWKAVQAAAG